MSEKNNFITNFYISNDMLDNYERNLKIKILAYLNNVGISLEKNINIYDKYTYKKLQAYSVLEFRKKKEDIIEKLKKKISPHLRSGKEIDPYKIKLKLIEVKSGTKEAEIYKFWNYAWWSMPWQQPYGRQMRFLIWDEYHDAPFGLIGLQSPILRQAVRDNYLKLSKEMRDYWVNQSLNAQRVGALPPYNYLLGGKFVASILVSKEIRESYYNKYKNKKTLIKDRYIPPNLLFITTTSAFGKSSLYNRLKHKNHLLAKNLGYTQGYGSFHIPDDLYKEIINFLNKKGIDTKRKYGDGPSKKIKLLSKAFSLLNLPNFTQHGLKREFFIFELCSNLHNVIHNEANPLYYNYSFNELFEWWLKNKCIPRSQRVESWKDFDKDKFLEQIYIKA